MLTVSCPDSRLDFQSFADQNGGVRVGLLHGRVLRGKERAVVELSGCWLRMRSNVVKDGNLPDGSAVFRGLAEVDAQLLERLGE
jgi:hypothetical protein